MNKQQSHDLEQDQPAVEEPQQQNTDFGSNQARGDRAREQGTMQGQEQGQQDGSFHSYGIALANSSRQEVAKLSTLIPQYASLASDASLGGGHAHTVSRSQKRRLRKLEADMEIALEIAENSISSALEDFNSISTSDLREALQTREGRQAIQRLKAKLQPIYRDARRYSTKLYRARKMLREFASYTSRTAKDVNLGIKGIGRQIKGVLNRIKRAER